MVSNRTLAHGTFSVLTLVLVAEEDAKLENLLRDDFVDDGSERDDALVPIQLPKLAAGPILKVEAAAAAAAVVVPGGEETRPLLFCFYGNEKLLTSVTDCGRAVKQEPTDAATETAFQRRKPAAEIRTADIFDNDGELIFLQVPPYPPPFFQSHPSRLRNEPVVKWVL